jgi:hypothetical protein
MTDPFAILAEYFADAGAADRRREPRYPADGRCEITPLSGGQDVLAGRVADVSRSGLRIQLPRQFQKGSRLRVQFGSMLVFVVVRWCCWVEGDTWEVGAEIDHTLSRALVERLRGERREETESSQTEAGTPGRSPMLS